MKKLTLKRNGVFNIMNTLRKFAKIVDGRVVEIVDAETHGWCIINLGIHDWVQAPDDVNDKSYQWDNETRTWSLL